MRALFVLVAMVALITTARAEEARGYLAKPESFAAAWATMLEGAGSDIDVSEIRIGADEIVIKARASSGGANIDQWRVAHQDLWLFERDALSGPSPLMPDGPVADVESGFFKLSAVPIDRFWQILGAAHGRAKLEDRSRIESVIITRTIAILPVPSYGEVRWSIVVTSGRENATVFAGLDGTIIGADISSTNRARTRDFYTQTDWPFADAQASFRQVVGERPEVYAIDVSASSVSMSSVSPDSAKNLRSWSWDGGAFTRGLVDSPNFDLYRSDANLPFALAEVDLTRISAVLEAAKAREPNGRPRIMSVQAAKEPVPTGTPRVLWTVQMVDSSRTIPLFGEDFDERTIVKLDPDGNVVSVLLPKSQRPVPGGAAGFTSAEGAIVALEGFRQPFGGEAGVVEVFFRPERASISMFAPNDPTTTVTYDFSDKGLENPSSFPAMMQSKDDVFRLYALSALDKGRLDEMRAKAAELIGIAGGEVYSIRVWSGSPFWPATPDAPLVDVRFGVPPRFDDGGYVVFRLDGSVVEVIK